MPCALTPGPSDLVITCRTYTYHALESRFSTRVTKMDRPLNKIRVVDFWGSVTRAVAGSAEVAFEGRGDDKEGEGAAAAAPESFVAQGSGLTQAVWQAHTLGLIG